MNELKTELSQRLQGVTLAMIPYPNIVFQILQLKSEKVTVSWAINKLTLMNEDGYYRTRGKTIYLKEEFKEDTPFALRDLRASALRYVANKLDKGGINV